MACGVADGEMGSSGPIFGGEEAWDRIFFNSLPAVLHEAVKVVSGIPVR